MNEFEKSRDRIVKWVEPQDNWTEEDWKHYRTVIKALEKQISKKPYFRKEEDAAGYACPVCDMGVTADKGRIRDAYCSHCGQFLDWSDTK